MQLGPSAAVVSLGKKLYSHCLSHAAVKLGTYCIRYIQGTAEEQLYIADAVIPQCRKISNKKIKKCTIANSEMHNAVSHFLL